MYHSMSQPSTQLLNLTFSSTCNLDVFSLSRVAFAFCICALNKIIASFLVHDSTKAAKSVWLSFLLSCAAASNSVARWMLFFTINSLTSNLERCLGLLFKLNNFLGGGSEVVEVSEDLPFLESLYTFVDFLVSGEDIFSRLGCTVVDWCIFLADVSISRVVVVMLIWEIDHNPLRWCDAFLYRLPTFRASDFQSNMIVVSTIVMFFEGASPVLHFNFPRSLVEMGFNAFPKFFWWKKF